MSIAGRNAMRGSTVQLYRKKDSPAAGGLTNRAWALERAFSLAIYTTTDAIARRIFGEELQVDATAMVGVLDDVRLNDAFVVIDGEHALRRFWVASARPIRRFVELGLSSTPEVIDASVPLPVGVS